MIGDYWIGPFAGHNRASFHSGSENLDRYFREQLSQDMRRRVANCFVAVDPSGDTAGFYTLAATSVALNVIAPDRARRLPRYPLIRAVLLGRLAVAQNHQDRHLGAALVADALLRAAHSDIAAHLMVVDAKDEKAARFYEHLEFERLADGGNRLIRAL
jgi:ribosomal protein S18 acetylase RimI-like enzyme